MSALTYTSYLKIDELLGLQEPLSEGPEHDEMLFIVIHQVYELWFKQILHELDLLKECLIEGDEPKALATLKRVLTIFKTLVAQIDVLETMTPISFNSFRYRLDSASGFQSFQFREMELLLGHKRESVVVHYPEGSESRELLQRRYDEPSLWHAFLEYLAKSGYEIPAEALDADPRRPTEPSEPVQRVLLDVYRDDPWGSQICERLVDLDEGVQEWRYRHVKMVERTIGTKQGTGGSPGAAYLKTTLFQPLFPDLWAIRVEL